MMHLFSFLGKWLCTLPALLFLWSRNSASSSLSSLPIPEGQGSWPWGNNMLTGGTGNKQVNNLAYGGSQTRGLNRAVPPGLHQSHSNTGSEPRLRPTSQLMASPDPNPLSKVRDPTNNLIIPSQIHFRCATMETPRKCFYLARNALKITS